MDAPTIEIFTEKRLDGVGDVVTGRRLAGRTVTIKVKNKNHLLNSVRRRDFVQFFNPSYMFGFGINYNGVYRQISPCYLKAFKIPTDNPYRGFEATITIYIETPWMFGAIISQYATTFVVNGDTTAFPRFTITAQRAGAYNPRVTVGNKYIQYNGEMGAGDVVVFDTESKTAYKNGQQVSVASGSDFGIVFSPGNVTVALSASGDIADNLRLVTQYYERFDGV